MSNVRKTALIITALTLGSKFLGFMREIALAYFYGTSYVIDAYVMAVAIPGIVFGWIASLAVAYTPIYMDAKVKLGANKSIRFTDNMISIGITISIFCVLIGVIFSSKLVSIIAPGFEGDVYELTDRFVKIYLFSIVINVFAQVLVSFLNCNSKFILSSISVFVVNGIQIVFIFISSRIGKDALIYGAVLSNIAQLIFLYVFSGRNGYRLRYEFKVTPEIKQAFIMLIPIFLSSMVSQLNGFVNKVFASGLIEGSVSALNYSMSVKTFIQSVFSVAITTMIYPMLSQSIAENDINAVKKMVSNAVNIIIILFIPITVGVVLLSEPAIFLVYERGMFSSESTAMTSIALQMYSLSLVAVCLIDVLTKMFYAMKDAKTILYLNTFTVAICIASSIILVKPMMHAGLALAGSLAEIITLPLFFFFLKRRIGNLGMKNSFNILVKSCICSAIMGITVCFVYNYSYYALSTDKLYILLSILISVAAGTLTYFVLMNLMKVKEMDFFTYIIKDIFRKAFGKI